MKREVSVRDFSMAPEYFTSQREIEKSFLLVIQDACTTNSLRSVATYHVIMCMQITTIKEEGNLKLRERSQKGSGERSMTLKEVMSSKKFNFADGKLHLTKFYVPINQLNLFSFKFFYTRKCYGRNIICINNEWSTSADVL